MDRPDGTTPLEISVHQPDLGLYDLIHLDDSALAVLVQHVEPEVFAVVARMATTDGGRAFADRLRRAYAAHSEGFAAVYDRQVEKPVVVGIAWACFDRVGLIARALEARGALLLPPRAD